MKTLVLSAADIQAATDRNGLRMAMLHALMALSRREAASAARHVIEIDQTRVMGFMPAFAIGDGIIGYKAVTVFQGNTKFGRDPHQGIVVLSNPESGEVSAILDGSTLTKLRTAAVSAAATDRLSRRDASKLTLLGTGRQAFEHALAIAEIRKLGEVVICGRSIEHAEELKRKLESHIDCKIQVVKDVRDAVRSADIVVACTASRNALLDIDDLPSGVHLNAIGACRPGYFEISLRSHPALAIYVDSREACAQEASEITDPIAKGLLDPKFVKGEIGALFAEEIEGRLSENQITVFKSVGLGIEDLMAADYVLARAREKRLGKNIDLGSHDE